MINEIMNIDSVITMSSLEIAELTGKRHANVLADIEKMLIELELAELKFQSGYLDSNNQNRKCYKLPKRECLGLVSGYNLKLRMAIIDRWQELEASTKPLTTAEQLLQSATWMVEAEKKLAQIPIMANKIEQLEEKIDHTNVVFHLGDYTTVKIYCKMSRIKATTKQSSRVGKKCAALCRERGIKIGQSPDPTYGTVNSYPVWVIEEFLDLIPELYP